MTRRFIPTVLTVVCVALSLAAAACTAEKKEGSGVLTKSTPTADYPLKTCVVTGEELGAMGDRVAYTYQGTEVQFCCQDCVKDFEKDPAKYIAEIKAAKK